MTKSGRVLPKWIAVLIALGISQLATAFAEAVEWKPESDIRLGLNGRTYPIGAQAVVSLGLGQLLWEDTAAPAPGKVNWKYGYFRVAANLATSAVVHRAGAELQLFPVSIFGMSAGYDIGTRNYTPKTIDCTQFECNGAMIRKYLRLQFLAAARGVVLSLQGRYEELRAPDAQKPFFDEMTLVVGRSEGERVLTWTPVLLYTLNERWQAGAAVLYSHALDTDVDSLLYGPVAGYKPAPEVTLLVGGGLNRSPVVHSAITGFFVFQWMFKGGVAITDRIVSEAPVPGSKNDI